MILFITLLFLFIAIALFFVLPPLLGRYKASETLHNELNLAIYQQKLEELDDDDLSDEQKTLVRTELEKSLLQDLNSDESVSTTNNTASKNPILTTTVAVTIPLLALFMYSMIGPEELPEILMGQAVSSSQADTGHGQSQLPDINKMVTSLEQKLEADPGNGEGWYMLGRSYMYMQRYQGAAEAFKKAIALTGEEPQLITDYAEAIALQHDGNLMGEPEKLIQQALSLQPMHPKSLWLAGVAKSQQGLYQEAINSWERLMTQHEAGSEGAVELQKRIDQVKQTMQDSGQTPVSRPASRDNAPATSQTTVTVSVELAAELKDKANPDDTLFIYARAVNGPPMPLAIVRKQVKDLPLTVSLDDSMAMMPSARMSNFEKIYISARISKSGTAQTEAGDMQGRSKIMTTGSEQQTSVIIETVYE
ncbi:MAG: c-type cytochrome biogenesis protein CcmI [Gammaproteobacteria bacterium]|nr:c-type cytochrome biogenesis protein CcmI [Gammaproteobacteria bacterium]